MALKPNGIPKKGSLDDAIGQVSRMKKAELPTTKGPPAARGGGSAVTRGTAASARSAPGRSDAGRNFDQSFAAAKRAGLDEFTWRGKRYTTKTK